MLWLDTKVNGTFRLLNMRYVKELRIERVDKGGCAWQLKLGAGTFGTVVGIYDNFDDAFAMYENICDALKNNLHYFKVREEEPVDYIAEP